MMQALKRNVSKSFSIFLVILEVLPVVLLKLFGLNTEKKSLQLFPACFSNPKKQKGIKSETYTQEILLKDGKANFLTTQNIH